MVELVEIEVKKEYLYWHNGKSITSYMFTIDYEIPFLVLKTSFIPNKWLISVRKLLDILNEYHSELLQGIRFGVYSKNTEYVMIAWSNICIEFVQVSGETKEVRAKLIVDTKEEMIECVEYLISYLGNIDESVLQKL